MHKRRAATTLLFAAACSVAMLSSNTAQGQIMFPTPTFEGLGFLQDGTITQATGVSGYGHVIVGFGNGTVTDPRPAPPNTFVTSRAFRYTAVMGPPAVLEQLPSLAGSTTFVTNVNGVSDTGSILVGQSTNSSGQTRAVYWTTQNDPRGPGFGTLDVPQLPIPTLNAAFPTRPQSGNAYAISKDGQWVVGQSSSSTTTNLTDVNTAFAYNINTQQLIGLPHPTGPGITATQKNGAARASNIDATVIVGNDLTNPDGVASHNRVQAQVWTLAAGSYSVQPLPDILTPPVTAFRESVANAVSDNGSLVVGFSPYTSAGDQHATLWTLQTGGTYTALDLDPRSTLGTFSKAFGISDIGNLIVGAAGPTGDPSNTEAFISVKIGPAQRTIMTLQSFLESKGVDVAGSGFTRLLSALAISDDGGTIVGYGLHNGKTEAFAAHYQVPEPGSLVLLSSTALLLARRRRK